MRQLLRQIGCLLCGGGGLWRTSNRGQNYHSSYCHNRATPSSLFVMLLLRRVGVYGPVQAEATVSKGTTSAVLSRAGAKAGYS